MGNINHAADEHDDPLAAVAHPEPAHNVGQDLGVSVEQLADDTGDPHVSVAHSESVHGEYQDLRVSIGGSETCRADWRGSAWTPSC